MICDKIGNYCFRRFLEELKVSKDECLPSCHQVRFTSTKIISKLDPSEICAFQHETVENSIARFLVDYGYYDVLHHKRHVMRNGNLNESIYDLKLNLCKKLVMKDIAKVSISFESKKYVRTLTNVKTWIGTIFRAIFDLSNKIALLILRRMYALFVKKKAKV